MALPVLCARWVLSRHRRQWHPPLLACRQLEAPHSGQTGRSPIGVVPQQRACGRRWCPHLPGGLGMLTPDGPGCMLAQLRTPRGPSPALLAVGRGGSTVASGRAAACVSASVHMRAVVAGRLWEGPGGGSRHAVLPRRLPQPRRHWPRGLLQGLDMHHGQPWCCWVGRRRCWAGSGGGEGDWGLGRARAVHPPSSRIASLGLECGLSRSIAVGDVGWGPSVGRPLSCQADMSGGPLVHAGRPWSRSYKGRSPRQVGAHASLVFSTPRDVNPSAALTSPPSAAWHAPQRYCI